MITLKSDDSLAVRIARLEDLARRYRQMRMWTQALAAEREALGLERRLRDAMRPNRRRQGGDYVESQRNQSDQHRKEG